GGHLGRSRGDLPEVRHEAPAATGSREVAMPEKPATPMKPPRPAARAGGLNQLPRWSIEHPYVVIAFYTAVVALAIIAIGSRMPRRFAPYVPSPMVGVVTMMPGLAAQE